MWISTIAPVSQKYPSLLRDYFLFDSLAYLVFPGFQVAGV